VSFHLTAPVTVTVKARESRESRESDTALPPPPQ
jgi:hypothetical protein